ncbi:unnamed protein product [Mucor hiemalis]
MTSYQPQLSMSPPPALPAHHMSPSPTPTVNPDMSNKSNEKFVERNHIPEMGHTHGGVHDDVEMASGEGKTFNKGKKKRRMDDRNCCLRCLCCACCLPAWATGILWFIIIAIIIVIIVIGAIAGTFVMPTVDMAGITTSPTGGSQLTFAGDSLNINFGLLINVNNPNLLSIGLSDMTATAYYPNPNGGHTKIGGGFLAQQEVPKYSNFNFTFPFALQYNPSYDLDQSVLGDLVEKCGLSGGSKSDITIDYTIRLTAKVLVIKVHPTISSSATFACPLDGGALPGLGDGTVAGLGIN